MNKSQKIYSSDESERESISDHADNNYAADDDDIDEYVGEKERKSESADPRNYYSTKDDEVLDPEQVVFDEQSQSFTKTSRKETILSEVAREINTAAEPNVKPNRSQRGMYIAAQKKGYQGSVYDWIKEHPNAKSQRELNKAKPKMSKKDKGKKGYASGLANLMSQKSAFSTPNEGVQSDG